MKRITLTILLTSMLLVFVGCQDDPGSTGIENPAPALTLSKNVNEVDILELLDTLEYEEFSGTLDPDASAFLVGIMQTWPGECLFSIQIPAGAAPSGEPTEFSMRIPTYQSYMDHADEGLPLIVRLEPSGVLFTEPLTVTATYMPWETVNSPNSLNFFSLYPDFELYGKPEVIENKGIYTLMFQVPHFSIWGIGGGGEM